MVTDQTELRLDDDEAEENGAEEGGDDAADDNGADDAGDAEDATESD
jgi:hypothetical protein